MPNTQKFRTRYAPSPTGHLHLGNARTALFSFLLARHYKGSFIIRIEDTDTKRNVKEGVHSQIENLRWLGIDYDEGPFKECEKYAPYYQSKRESHYIKYLNILLEKKLAYQCFCSKDELEKQREEQINKGKKAPMYDGRCSRLSKESISEKLKSIKPLYRFSVKKGEDIVWKDLVRNKISFERSNIEDFVILKSNGLPTYNFANVVDDIEMEISHIVRGEEHISNTPKQILLYKAFEKACPKFGHLPIIINKKGKKLSKRDTEEMQFISDYKEEGIFPEAVINYLSLLGWSPKEEREVFSEKELIDRFDFDRISKAPSQYDITKLFWFNKEYINKLSEARKNKFRKELFEDNKRIIFNSEEIDLLDFVSRVIGINEWTLKKHKEVVLDIFKNIEEATKKNNSVKWLGHVEKEIEKITIDKNNLTNLEKEIKDIINEVKNTYGLKGRDLFHPLRERFSNKEKGPEIWRILLIYSVLKV